MPHSRSFPSAAAGAHPGIPAQLLRSPPLLSGSQPRLQRGVSTYSWPRKRKSQLPKGAADTEPGEPGCPRERGCSAELRGNFLPFLNLFLSVLVFPRADKKTPNSSRHCARARSRGSASLCPPPSPLSAGTGGSAGAPRPAASQHFCPRTRPDLLRSNLPCSIVRVPFAHHSPPRPSCSASQHRLPGAERFCSVFPSLAVPRAEPGRGWAGGRSCPVSSSALPSAAQELPSPHPEQTEPGRPGQAGARALLLGVLARNRSPGCFRWEGGAGLGKGDGGS